MNHPDPASSTALQRFEPQTAEAYSIETVVHITQTPRHRIAVYCHHGLISPITAPEQDGWLFDDEAIRALGRIEHLRLACGVNLAGIRIITDLLRELEQRRAEVRLLRAR